MSITSANSVLMLSISTLFTVPQQLQGWAADEAFETEAIESTEVLMGIDGNLSGGFVYAVQPMTITLQADSPSVSIFEAWQAAQITAQDAYVASGILRLPSLNRKWSLVKGFLRTQVQIPQARRILQPRRFSIAWNFVQPSPL